MNESPPFDWDDQLLKQLAALVPQERTERLENEAFGQLLASLYLGSEQSSLPIEVLKDYVGEPDRIIDTAEGTVWL